MKWKDLVPEPKGYERIISRNADPHNTVREMERIARNNADQTKRLAAYINSMKGCRLENLWEGVRENVKYTFDPEKAETLRTPSRTVHDGKGDCDCMSILISSVLLNWGVPHAFRVVEVDKGAGWAHVYVVAKSGNREIVLDTVPEIKSFGQQHKFYKKFDHIMYTQELGRLSKASQGEVKQQLSDFLLKLKAAETDGEGSKQKQDEVMLLTSVIETLGTDLEEKMLENAANRSKLLQDVYIDIFQASRSEGLGSIFSKIKEKLDQLGETGIGKAFRSVRDAALPLVDPLNISGKAGAVFNKIAEDGNATPEQVKEVAENLKKEGIADADKKAEELIKANNINISTDSKAGIVDNINISTDSKAGIVDESASLDKEPWYKTKWAKWGGAGLIALIILWAVYYFSRRSALSGAKKRRRRRTSTASKKSYSLRGISMPRAKSKAKPKKRKAVAAASKAKKRRAKKK